jgi:hypothetical protein
MWPPSIRDRRVASLFFSSSTEEKECPAATAPRTVVSASMRTTLQYHGEWRCPAHPRLAVHMAVQGGQGTLSLSLSWHSGHARARVRPRMIEFRVHRLAWLQHTGAECTERSPASIADHPASGRVPYAGTGNFCRSAQRFCLQFTTTKLVQVLLLVSAIWEHGENSNVCTPATKQINHGMMER